MPVSPKKDRGGGCSHPSKIYQKRKNESHSFITASELRSLHHSIILHKKRCTDMKQVNNMTTSNVVSHHLDRSSNADDSSTDGSGNLTRVSSSGSSNTRDDYVKTSSSESSQINWLRAVLALVMCAAMFAASFTIFRVTRGGEIEQFNSHYEDNAIKIIDTFESSLRNRIGVLDNYAIVSSTQANDEEEWPFQVAPKFEVRGASSRSFAVDAFLTVIPLVTLENRFDWEVYTQNNTQWIQDGLEFAQNHGGEQEEQHAQEEDSTSPEEMKGHGDHGDHRVLQIFPHEQAEAGHQEQAAHPEYPTFHEEIPASCSNGISSAIFQINERNHQPIVEFAEEEYWPMWQSTPVHRELVNFNAVSHGAFGQDLEQAVMNSQIVLGRVADVSNAHDPFNFLYQSVDLLYPDNGEEGGPHQDSMGEEEMHDSEEDGQSGMDDGGHGGHGGGHAHRHRKLHHSGAHVVAESTPRSLQIFPHEQEPSDHEGHGGDEVDHGDDELDQSCFIRDADHDESGQDHTGQIGSFSGDFGDPVAMTFFPIFDRVDEPRNIVGVLAAAIYWRDFLVNVLTPGAQPTFAVLENECGQSFSFLVDGDKVQVAGYGDLHETRFDHEEINFKFDSIVDTNNTQRLTFSGVGLDTDYCGYTLRVFPTTEMEEHFLTRRPAMFAFMVVATFIFASFIFICYDILVSNRQRKISRQAEQTSAVVNSLFPANVRDRLFENAKSRPNATKNADPFVLPRNQLTGSVRNLAATNQVGQQTSLPIADLFPNATVLFADISGFTAWSSSREPTQVFVLLETIYGKFDSIAKRMKVFKVETIGDCYVAVTGVPEAQQDHAVIMASKYTQMHIVFICLSVSSTCIIRCRIRFQMP